MYGESDLGNYLKEIGRYPLLTPAREISLAQEMHDPSGTPEGRDRARRELITSNLRLVVSIAKKYLRSGVPLADLIAEGNVGLMKAIRGFDWTRGNRISTYATFWIRQSIQIAIREHGKGIRLPSYMSGVLARVRDARERLRQALGREPMLTELHGSLDPETRALLKRFLDSEGCGRVVNIDEVLKLQHIHSAEVEGDPWPRWSEIEEVLHKVKELLDDRESRILRMRYGLNGEPDGMTLSEIGLELGITRERVRQLEARAIRKLRKELQKVPA